MHPYQFSIEVWCEETWGERPKKISEWVFNDGRLQLFLKLSASALIADFEVKDGDELHIHQHLHIPLETWNPGSIQAIRTNDGRVRFSHRRQSIYLSSQLRAPEWGAALLDEWLLSLRGEVTRPKERGHHIAEIERMKLSIERHLESASLNQIQKDINELSQRIDRIDANLAE